MKYVEEFADDWLKRAKGEKISIEGTMYLISPVSLEEPPPGSVVLVTERVTPYDLLEKDGTLKEPKE